MSSPPKLPPATPLRAARFKSATPGSPASARVQCSDDPADFTLVKIHTAKCSICDKRNTTDEMRRCKGCTWQICHPCQIEREQKGRSLAHGNLMTGTPSTAPRRSTLLSIGALADVKDPDAEAALARIKAEEADEVPVGRKKTDKSTLPAKEVITPPSSSERPKRERKAKPKKSLAEEVEYDDDDDEVQMRDHLSPFGGAGSKRRLGFKDTSSAVSEPPGKRARQERPERMKAPIPLPAEWDMSPREKADLQTKTYANLADVRGIRPSEHPTTMQDKFGIGLAPGPSRWGSETTQAQSVLHRSMPTPMNRPTSIPILISQYGKPRKTGEEFMEEVRQKETDPPTELTAQELRNGNLRDLVDNEVRNLHHNLTLDEDQQSELVSAMKGAARKFGNDMVKLMPVGFRALAKSGLDVAMEHLTHAQQLQAIALIQTQAGHKLKEFEAEGNPFSVGAQDDLGPENVGGSRESFERST